MIKYIATAYGLRTGDVVDSLCFDAGDDDAAIVRARDWLDALGSEYRVELERIDHTPVADLHP